MRQNELGFHRIIRTHARAQPQFPLFLESVEQAIDHLQELPPPLLSLTHWQAAKLALWAALDCPDNPACLALADRALCAALKSEGWLDEIPPA